MRRTLLPPPRNHPPLLLHLPAGELVVEQLLSKYGPKRSAWPKKLLKNLEARNSALSAAIVERIGFVPKELFWPLGLAAKDVLTGKAGEAQAGGRQSSRGCSSTLAPARALPRLLHAPGRALCMFLHCSRFNANLVLKLPSTLLIASTACLSQPNRLKETLNPSDCVSCVLCADDEEKQAKKKKEAEEAAAAAAKVAADEQQPAAASTSAAAGTQEPAAAAAEDSSKLQRTYSQETPRCAVTGCCCCLALGNTYAVRVCLSGNLPATEYGAACTAQSRTHSPDAWCLTDTSHVTVETERAPCVMLLPTLLFCVLLPTLLSCQGW